MVSNQQKNSRQRPYPAVLLSTVRRASFSVPAALNPLIFGALIPALAAHQKSTTTSPPPSPGPGPRTAAVMIRMIRGTVWHAVLGYRNSQTNAIELRSYARVGTATSERHDLSLVAFGDLYDVLERRHKGGTNAPVATAAGVKRSHPTDTAGEVSNEHDVVPDQRRGLRKLATSRGAQWLRSVFEQIGERLAPATRHTDESSNADNQHPSQALDDTGTPDATLVYVANSQLHNELVGLQSSFPLAHFVRYSDFPDTDLLDAISQRLDEPPSPQRTDDGVLIDFGFSADPLQVATDASLGLRRPGAGLACVDQHGNWSASFASSLRDISLAEVSSVLLALETFPSRPLNLLVDSKTAVRWLQTDDADVPSRARALVAKTRSRLTKSGSSVSWVRGHAGHHLNETADRLSRACRRDEGLTDATVAKERGDWIVQDAFSAARMVAAPHYIDLRDSSLAEFITIKLDNLG